MNYVSLNMDYAGKSIRPFIGAQNFQISRSFYNDLGFDEVVLSPQMSLFQRGKIAFYLQDAYVEDWVNNSMVFVELDDLHIFFNEISALNLPDKYDEVRVSQIKIFEWGKECYLHDPAGILWHFGEFTRQPKN